jgi:hypothetical protein
MSGSLEVSESPFFLALKMAAPGLKVAYKRTKTQCHAGGDANKFERSKCPQCGCKQNWRAKKASQRAFFKRFYSLF